MGNFGEEYTETRHNVGFKAIDWLISEKQIQITPERFGDMGRFRLKGNEIYLIKPSTFMNRSGRSVHFWFNKLKLNTDRLLVVVDDVHLPFGTFRLRKSGSDGGHNGLRSIQEHLGSTDYPRLRIGIGTDFEKGRQVNFVLGGWTDQEQIKLPEILTYSEKIIESFILDGIDTAMNTYNKKSGIDFGA